MAITIEDVERFRAADLRSVILARHRQVVRDATATAAFGEIVYTVTGQAVTVRQVPGGYTPPMTAPTAPQATPASGPWPRSTRRAPSGSSSSARPPTTRS